MTSKHDHPRPNDGREYLDPTPHPDAEVSAGFTNGYETMAQMIQRQIRSLSIQEDNVPETFEDANDFEVDEDEPDFISAYEFNEMAPEPIDTEIPSLSSQRTEEPTTELDPNRSESSSESPSNQDSHPPVSSE